MALTIHVNLLYQDVLKFTFELHIQFMKGSAQIRTSIKLTGLNEPMQFENLRSLARIRSIDSKS